MYKRNEQFIKVFACIRFRFYGFDAKKSKKRFITRSMYDTELQPALDVALAFSRAYNWVLVTYECFDYGERGIRL